MNKVLMAIVCVLGFSTIQAKEIDSFEEAKRLLPEVFKGQETTFYCGCKYAKLGKRFVVDPLCKTYTPKKPYTKNGKKMSELIVLSGSTLSLQRISADNLLVGEMEMRNA